MILTSSPTLADNFPRHYLDSPSTQEDILEVYSSGGGRNPFRINLSLLGLARSPKDATVPLVLTQEDFDFDFFELARLDQWFTPGKAARFAALPLIGLLKLIKFAQTHLLEELEVDVTKAFIMKIVLEPFIPSPATIANTSSARREGPLRPSSSATGHTCC